MIATKQDSQSPANTQTHLQVCLNNTSGDLPSNVQNKHKLYTAVAASPPSSSKDEASWFRVSHQGFFTCTRCVQQKWGAYPSCWPQVLDDPFYSVHNISPHGFLLWPRWDEIKEIHYFLMKTEIKKQQNTRDHKQNIGSKIRLRSMILDLWLMVEKSNKQVHGDWI